MPHKLSPQALQNIETAFSRQRLTRYVQLANGDLGKAFELHDWNTSLGEALNMPLQRFELLLRNRIHDALSARFSSAWYDARFTAFDARGQRIIEAAKDALINKRLPVTPEAVIVQFTFGFWLTLLTRRYDTPFWRTALWRCFPNAPKPLSRHFVHDEIESIRTLRNRIAHHEPIYQRLLLDDLTHIVGTAALMCPYTADYIELCRPRLAKAINDKP